MERRGGGCNWADDHNSPWEYDKTNVLDFFTAQKRRYVDSPPPLVIQGHEIKSVQSARYLGVILDSSLSFREHAEKAITKGLRYVSLISRFSRSNKGMRARHIRRLYVSVAIPKMTYASDVWFTPITSRPNGTIEGSRGFAKRLGKVQRVAALKITGTLRSSPNDLLDLHADLWPVKLLMDKAGYRAILRMCTLDDSNPISSIVRTSARRPVAHHPSPIHRLLVAYKLDPRLVEKMPPFSQNTKWSSPVTTLVEKSRNAAIARDSAAQAEYDTHIYTDGSSDDSGVGAAAVLLRPGQEPKRLTFHLGPPDNHTVFEAEAVGLLLGIHLASQEPDVRKVRLGLDNMAVISASRWCKPRPGHHIIRKAHDALEIMMQRARDNDTPISFHAEWTPGHCGVHGNELADQAAKAAAQGLSSPDDALPEILREPLPLSASALRRQYNDVLGHRWLIEWTTSVRFSRMSAVDPHMSPRAIRRLLHDRPRHETSLITQLRIGHVPLNKHLHRIGKYDSPTCSACERRPETVRHFLLECPSFSHHRWNMRLGLGQKSDSISTLLSTPLGIQRVLAYVNHTRRLRAMNGVPPHVH